MIDLWISFADAGKTYNNALITIKQEDKNMVYLELSEALLMQDHVYHSRIEISFRNEIDGRKTAKFTWAVMTFTRIVHFPLLSGSTTG